MAMFVGKSPSPTWSPTGWMGHWLWSSVSPSAWRPGSMRGMGSPSPATAAADHATTSTAVLMGSGPEHFRDFSLDLHRLGAGVRGMPDWAPHDDVVRPSQEGVPDIHRPLLVARVATGGPDPRAHDQEVLAQLGTQPGRLQPRGDHPVAAQVHAAPRPRQDELLRVALVSHVLQVPPVQAREHRDGQYLDVSPCRHRGLDHRVAAVDRRKGDLARAQLLDREPDRLGDVEELDVGKDPLALRIEPVDHLEVVARHEELEA